MIRAPLALGVGLGLIVACTPAAPPATATTPPPLPQAEAEAWGQVRSALPGVPIIVPTWLPPSIDRTRVEVRMGHGSSGQNDPRYEVAYLTSSDAKIVFALGPTSDIAGSGMGTRVRNSTAVLSFDTNLFTDPSQRSPRRVRWQEGPYVLRIESDRFTGEELLHIAWSLDRTGQPAPKTPYAHVKRGVCAIAGAPPEDTVRLLLSFVGGRDRDSVADCFSLELLGEHPGYAGWADLPTTSNPVLRPPSDLGGRKVIGATWSFASDPGGAWGRQAHQFFTLGLEDGAWRVYETATAVAAPPP